MLRFDFEYELPSALIAQNPPAKRGESRLLVDRDGQKIHSEIKELRRWLPSGAVLVLNDTRVINARLFGLLRDKRIEVFLLENPRLNNGSYEAHAFARPARALSKGSVLTLDGGVRAQVLAIPSRDNEQRFLLRLSAVKDIDLWLKAYGSTPLPPYIARENLKSLEVDQERYQTVYAHTAGSVAAPTAGLHFTEAMLAQLRAQGIKIVTCTLHIGSGTFKPVRNKHVADHLMHQEHYYVSKETVDTISEARKSSSPVIAMGTTSFRSIEDLFRFKKSADSWQSTRLFIYPKNKDDIYRSEVFSGMITNFHQPASTLYMLICALLGYERARQLYLEAVAKKYRFLSYGDACFLEF